jgi:sigma-E factor negative regulatory protein RseA
MTEPNETVQSQLSAFVDDELPKDETELLARRVSRDTELQQSMSRYLLIGEALRSPSQARLSRDFPSRVAAAIEQQNESGQVEATTSVATAKSGSRAWLKPAIGMSLAAGVAAISLMTIHNLQSASGDNSAVQIAATNMRSQLPNTAANSDVVPVATTAPSVPISAARLTNYVVAHSEFTSPLGHRNTTTGLVTGDQQTETDEAVDEAGATK